MPDRVNTLTADMMVTIEGAVKSLLGRPSMTVWKGERPTRATEHRMSQTLVGNRAPKPLYRRRPRNLRTAGTQGALSWSLIFRGKRTVTNRCTRHDITWIYPTPHVFAATK